MNKIKKWELRKCLLNKFAIALMIILFIGKIISAIVYNANLPEGVDTDIYKEYMKTLEGKYTKEKSEYIENEMARISSLENSQFSYVVKYDKGLISKEEFDNIMYEIRIAPKMLSTLSYISSKCDYYENSYREGIFFYDLDIQRYMSVMGLDFIGLTFVIYICMSLYFSDISAKTTVLVTTSYYGKKYTNRIRLILGLIICVLSTIILSITEFVAKYITMDIDYLKMPVKAMLDMNSFAFDINIGSGLLVIYGGRVLLTVVIVLGFSIAARIKTNLQRK
jgi:hypothetical protein